MRYLLLATLLLCPTFPLAAEDLRPRLIILTDIGGDPDDQQSLIRLMLYSNEFELEGLIASSSGTLGELPKAVVRTDLVREIVEAYGKVQKNLVKHAEGYPEAQQLRDVIKTGNQRRGREAIGEDHDTEASKWILRAMERDDPRPLNIAIWGGQTDFAQALWRARATRSEAELAKLLKKLRVYDINDQDKVQSWIFENFPDLFYVLATAYPGHDKREGAYRGMYLGGDESLTSTAWLDAHLRKGHGPLGELYPVNTWTAPNPHSALKEGDTPSWFYFLPQGLQDPDHPDWGGWGGRFKHAEHGLWRDAVDQVGRDTNARATVYRWRPAYQSELAARADWCVKKRDDANHSPAIMINGDRARRPLALSAPAGKGLELDASGATDPDKDGLTFRWLQYREAGTYEGDVSLENIESPKITLPIPSDAQGKTIHLVLEVTDKGTQPLTSLRRVVVEVK